MKKLLGILLALVLLVLQATPVFAIGNPDDIDILYAKVFENIFATDDMLLIVHYYVHYAATPDEDADDTYAVHIYSADGTDIIVSRNLNYYEYNIISIYLTSAQQTSLGISWGTHYKIRVQLNPTLCTPSEGTNMVTSTLSSSDWIEGTQSESRELLKDACIDIAGDLEDEHSDTYLILTTEGEYVLNSDGRTIFVTAIPGLDSAIPSMFQLAQETIEIDRETVTAALESNTTILGELGSGMNNAFSGIGDWLGVSGQSAATMFFLLIILVPLMAIIFLTTGSSSGALILSAPLAIYSAKIGLMSVAIMFVIIIAVAAYAAYDLFLKQM